MQALLNISEDPNELLSATLEQFKIVDDYISERTGSWKDKHGNPKRRHSDPSVDRYIAMQGTLEG